MTQETISIHEENERYRAKIVYNNKVEYALSEVRSGHRMVGKSATSGKAGGLKKVEPLKADRSCEPLKAVRV